MAIQFIGVRPRLASFSSLQDANAFVPDPPPAPAPNVVSPEFKHEIAKGFFTDDSVKLDELFPPAKGD